MKLFCRFASLFALVLLALPGLGQRPLARLHGPISGSGRITLPHSRVPLTDDAEDAGTIAPATRIPGITLVFRRSEAQEAALKKLLAAQQDPESPLYHHWLTPDDFAAQFGVADQDIAATEAWLKAQGFDVDSISRSRDRITFSGTAAQVQAAFGAELRRYRLGDEVHFAPANDLSLPAQLAPLTAAVLHISDFRPKAQLVTGRAVRPNLTGASTQQHLLTPKDIATMYNLTPLYQKLWKGAGQRIAVVGQSYVNTVSGPVATFLGNMAQVMNVTPVLVPNSGVNAISPGDESESELDLEYSSAIAPNADIFFVYVGSNQNYDVFDAIAYAITEDVAPVVSISYGTCELTVSQSALEQANALFAEAAAQGQTLVASSGDTGSTQCAYYSPAQGVTTAQQQALAVSFPASSPYVTAVGGTQMAEGTFAAGASSYWQSSAGSDVVNSLLSYVPEVAWNESSTQGIVAGGGGSSSYFTRPDWQSGVSGIPSGSYRLLPDVSLQSSTRKPGFVFCTTDPSVVGQSGSCTNGLRNYNGSYTIAGGTSFAAPIFAGFVAILNQSQNAAGQGNINPALYKLASDATTYASVFHDIVSGTNACTPGASVCSTAGQSNYAAGTGYDEATGLGSLDFNALATAWPSGPSAKMVPTLLTLSPSLTSQMGNVINGRSIFVPPGQSVAVSISLLVANSSVANPANFAGTISISLDGSPLNAALPVTATNPGMYTTFYTVTAPTTTGSHVLVFTYSGDSTHSPATRALSLTVGSSSASGSITVSAGNLSVANNSTGTTQITVTPSGGYNGRVVWSLSATAASAGAPQLSGCYWINPLLVNNTITTQLKMGVGSACSTVQPQARIAVQTAQARGPVDLLSGRRGIPAGALYVAFVFGGMLGMKRRRWPSLLGVAIAALVLSAGLTGCGGSSGNTGSSNSSGNPAPPQTQAASYTFRLTASDSVNASITASTTFTMTVQ
jgi:subtilase family serine protease